MICLESIGPKLVQAEEFAPWLQDLRREMWE